MYKRRSIYIEVSPFQFFLAKNLKRKAQETKTVGKYPGGKKEERLKQRASTVAGTVFVRVIVVFIVWFTNQ